MKQIFYILLILCVFGLFGCSEQPEPKKTVVSIEVIDATVPEKILIAELDEKLNEIKIDVTYSDGSKEVINLDKTMIFPNDIEKLKKGGKFKIKISYDYVSTEIVLNTFLVFPIIYTINIQNPDGTPLVDTNVILYNDDIVNRYLTTDLNGSCSIELDPAKYYFKIDLIEKGYLYFKPDCTIDADTPTKTITLIKVLDFVSGDGTSFNPYIVDTGIYNFVFDQENILGMKYFKFVPSESAVYTIESISYSNYNNKHVDPYLIFIDNDGNYDKSGNFDSTSNVDFKYSFNAEIGKTYSFIIFISNAAEYPTNLVLKIS